MNSSRKSPSPRIYTYKVTFPHQGWWYWGWHKEREFGENYSGTPVAHKQKWENFEWEVQILECFDCEIEAQRVEKRLISPDLNNPLCLNEHCGGLLSVDSCRKGGEAGGWKESKKEKKGLWSPEHKGSGWRKLQELGLGIHAPGVSSLGGKMSSSGKIQAQKGLGCHKPEIRSRAGKKGSSSTNSQVWKCLITGRESTASGLSVYQKKRNIDTSLRKRVK